jgi:hypothetical protein
VLAAIGTLTPASLEGFDEFSNTVRRAHPDVTVVSPWWVAKQARSVERSARYFGAIFRRSRPRSAFCSVYYTLVGMAFCLAARRLGIPAIDIQHGVTAGNPAYEGWTRFPDSGFELLPSCFWCWSDEDARPLRGWPESARRQHRVVVGGHPWDAFWRADHRLAEGFKEKLPRRNAGSLTVLATLTWSSGLSTQLKNVIVNSPPEWNWWIRMHPLMGRERSAIRSWCNALEGRSIEVDRPSDLPLPLLLKEADVHLTHNSTVVQEAARGGMASVVIDPHARDVYTDQLGTGWAVFADQLSDVLESIVNQARMRRTLEPIPPYPSWADMASALRELLAGNASCPVTAPTASSPIAARV